MQKGMSRARIELATSRYHSRQARSCYETDVITNYTNETLLLS